ncbi:MAG: hypothetical protein H6545_01125 [Bacteroidales bacterium]|jgi:hypothetical protein|nr:hypothetical protein [Bacteroidales bacterium]MDD3735992.1 hypothetical protein [Bacteroidales bacterium]NLD63339.1 hypothetical protein [Bacteroidales bacterium]HOO65528.1 hypothetical protein [Bacteroidales bacterium]HPE22973.1 hypothetical protein [Bacteroidales bacterium]
MKKSIFSMTGIKRYLLVAAIIIVAIILLANKLVIWGAAFLAAGLIILGIQQLILLNVKVSRFEDNITGLEEKNQSLAKMNEKLMEENEFLKERHFQITQIKSILEMNLFEIDTRFKRTVNKTEQLNDREIRYIGSLGVSLKAKYGIDLKELRFKYLPESDELIVANINPRFLSFGNRKLEWEFFETLEYRRQLPLTVKRWMTSDDLAERAEKLKEEIRLETEHSLESGPEEFAWIMEPIRENVENTIRIMFKGVTSNIRIAEMADNTFVPIEGIKLGKLEENKRLK